MTWPTFAAVVSQAAIEMGLKSAAISDPFIVTDPNILQLNALLNALGLDLARRYQWTHLQKEHAFYTEANVSLYEMPSDFLRLLDGTVWNRTDALPVPEGATPAQWQAMKSGTVVPIFQVSRIFGNLTQIHPVPSSAQIVAYEYQSGFWLTDAVAAWAPSETVALGARRTNDGGKVYVCTTAGETAGSGGPTGTASGQGDNTAVWGFLAYSVQTLPPNGESCDTATDLTCFDSQLLVAGLRLAFRKTKGFDTSMEQADFDAALAAARGGDGMAPVLRLGPVGDVRLLDDRNLPPTGFGV